MPGAARRAAARRCSPPRPSATQTLLYAGQSWSTRVLTAPGRWRAIHLGQVQISQDIAVDGQKRPAPQDLPQLPQAPAGTQNLRLVADAEREAPGLGPAENRAPDPPDDGCSPPPGNSPPPPAAPAPAPTGAGSTSATAAWDRYPSAAKPRPQPRRQHGRFHRRISFGSWGKGLGAFRKWPLPLPQIPSPTPYVIFP